MARTSKPKMIKLTLEVEPPYTGFAVLTFGGGAGGGLAVTSSPIKLQHGSTIHVGENGGIEQMTTKEAKRRKSVKDEEG